MIVFCTVPDKNAAQKIARALVTEKLCACVNQIPRIKSYYVYDNEFCEDNELLLLIKTDKEHFSALQERIKTLHPYELPEIIATEISDASPEYAAWLHDSLR